MGAGPQMTAEQQISSCYIQGPWELEISLKHHIPYTKHIDDVLKKYPVYTVPECNSWESVVMLSVMIPHPPSSEAPPPRSKWG